MQFASKKFSVLYRRRTFELGEIWSGYHALIVMLNQGPSDTSNRLTSSIHPSWNSHSNFLCLSNQNGIKMGKKGDWSDFERWWTMVLLSEPRLSQTIHLLGLSAHTTHKHTVSWGLGVKGQNGQSGWGPWKGHSHVGYQGWANEVGGQCLSGEASGPQQEPQQHFLMAASHLHNTCLISVCVCACVCARKRAQSLSSWRCFLACFSPDCVKRPVQCSFF